MRGLMKLALGLCVVGVASAGCAPPPTGIPVSFSVHGESRVSQPFRIVVPAHSRSITIIVRGDPEVLYALASFKVGGKELQDIPPQDLADKLHSAYFADGEGTGQPPGSLLQFARLGTFTFLYPYAKGQPLPAGPLELRIAASRAHSDVEIAVLMPKEDGASILHLNLLRVSDKESAALPDPQAILQPAQAIFAQAGISLRLNSVEALRGTEFSSIPTLSEPWEKPSGLLAQLAQLGQGRVASPGLNVYVVDALPTGSDGVSLGLPGPPLPASPFFGVVLRNAEPAELGRTLAHEVAHFLGLRHVRTVAPSGAVLTDGIDDTEPDGNNLMERGQLLTPSQIYVLSRSPLLKRR